MSTGELADMVTRQAAALRERDQRIRELEAGLRECVVAIYNLADQQAMPDNAHVVTLEKAEALLAKGAGAGREGGE